jgi:3-dehydroquinate dehydratase-2
MKILIINGPNLNMLGIREPEHYGNETYSDLENKIRNYCQGKCEIEIKQSNHEGVLVDYIQGAYFNGFDGIVINPGAYAHYSYAIHDAIKSVPTPCVEVHISDISKRDEFRRISVTAPACDGMISGEGFAGYTMALEKLINESK